MDVYCPVCGEPWEHDTLHEETQLQLAENGYARPEPFWSSTNPVYREAFESVAADFRRRGCAALPLFRGSETPCKPRDSKRAELAAALYDVLGNDMDGAASEMLDAEQLGWF